MVEVHPLVFTKAGLASVPKQEILFHLLLAQAANEVLILRKQMMLAGNAAGPPGAISDAAVAIAQVNLRLLAGRLYEGYRLLKSPEAGAIFQTYKAELDPEAIEARKAIMKYFGAGQSLIEKVRNKASFHWDYKTNLQAFEEMPNDLPLTDYIAWEVGNTLYYSGALLSQGQMATLLGMNDTVSASDRMHGDVTTMSNWFDTYAQGFMLAFAVRYLSPSEELFSSVRQNLEGCPDIQSATLPYFLDTESLTPEVRERIAREIEAAP